MFFVLCVCVLGWYLLKFTRCFAKMLAIILLQHINVATDSVSLVKKGITDF